MKVQLIKICGGTAEVLRGKCYSIECIYSKRRSKIMLGN